jgi:hypothetical protein
MIRDPTKWPKPQARPDATKETLDTLLNWFTETNPTLNKCKPEDDLDVSEDINAEIDGLWANNNFRKPSNDFESPPGLESLFQKKINCEKKTDTRNILDFLGLDKRPVSNNESSKGFGSMGIGNDHEKGMINDSLLQDYENLKCENDSLKLKLIKYESSEAMVDIGKIATTDRGELIDKLQKLKNGWQECLQYQNAKNKVSSKKSTDSSKGSDDIDPNSTAKEIDLELRVQ